MTTTAQAITVEDFTSDMKNAVERTFQQMFQMPLKCNLRSIKREEIPPADVSALIGLMQKDPQGALLVIFPKQTILTLLKGFFKKDFAEIDRIAIGSVGEVANIVFGIFKHSLSARGMSLSLAVPQVIVGATPRISDIDWLVCGDFESPAGSFHVILMRTEPKS